MTKHIRLFKSKIAEVIAVPDENDTILEIRVKNVRVFGLRIRDLASEEQQEQTTFAANMFAKGAHKALVLANEFAT